jgi:integrase
MKKRTRLFVRNQGGSKRFYGDFRDFSDVGGRREALIPVGAERATTDEQLAQMLLSERLAELDGFRRRRQRGETLEDAYLKAYAKHHIALKRQAGNATQQWLEAAEIHLRAAGKFFSTSATADNRSLESISVGDVQRYVAWLASQTNGRGGTLSSSSQRKYLNSLSNLYRRAISERRVPLGYNPVASLLEKPQEGCGRQEAKWLEVHEAALLLAYAGLYVPNRLTAAIPPITIHAILATMLLTGGRPSEVLGLQRRDVSFERRLVTFRPNSTRQRLKTASSFRSVRLWPQLNAILSEYCAEHASLAPNDLLFSNPKTGQRLVDIRKALDTISAAAGHPFGSIRPYAFRHTYCAARLQSLDNGAPISPFTVAKELGHGGLALVNHVYGHLGHVRHRSEVVEFDVSQHVERLGARYEAFLIASASESRRPFESVAPRHLSMSCS